MLALEGKPWVERAADDMRNKALNLSDTRSVGYHELANQNSAPCDRYPPARADEVARSSAAAQTGAAELVEDHRSKNAPTRNA